MIAQSVTCIAPLAWGLVGLLAGSVLGLFVAGLAVAASSDPPPPRDPRDPGQESHGY